MRFASKDKNKIHLFIVLDGCLDATLEQTKRIEMCCHANTRALHSLIKSTNSLLVYSDLPDLPLNKFYHYYMGSLAQTSYELCLEQNC